MEQAITLTVISFGGYDVDSESEVFISSHIRRLKEHADGAQFYYPDENGRIQHVVVSNAFSNVEDLIEANSASIGAKKELALLFDATAGKAIGSHNLVDLLTGEAVTLPDNAIITRSWYEVIETFTSATDAATIALGIPTDDVAGIKAAVAISNGANAWDAGLVEGIQTGTAANMSEKTTAARAIQATVAEEALTDGKLALFIEYVVSI